MCKWEIMALTQGSYQNFNLPYQVEARRYLRKNGANSEKIPGGVPKHSFFIAGVVQLQEEDQCQS